MKEDLTPCWQYSCLEWVVDGLIDLQRPLLMRISRVIRFYFCHWLSRIFFLTEMRSKPAWPPVSTFIGTELLVWFQMEDHEQKLRNVFSLPASWNNSPVSFSSVSSCFSWEVLGERPEGKNSSVSAKHHHKAGCQPKSAGKWPLRRWKEEIRELQPRCRLSSWQTD